MGQSYAKNLRDKDGIPTMFKLNICGIASPEATRDLSLGNPTSESFITHGLCNLGELMLLQTLIFFSIKKEGHN